MENTPLEDALNALKVFALDQKIKAWLKENDPKALQQAEQTIQRIETYHAWLDRLGEVGGKPR